MRFQQLSGPVMAKGVEDTAFYRYLRLLALNEVGSDPRRFGIAVAASHRLCEVRAARWPHAMLAASTHDTKRGEDARARLMLMTEMPETWDEHLRHWDQINRLRRSEIDGETVPDRNDEYCFYQTVVAAWPPDLAPDDVERTAAFAARVKDAMVKAVREGKERSSWQNPNGVYEAALERFMQGALDASRPNPFLADVHALVEKWARPGAIVSLAQALLRLTAPGVPDMYQGAELWNFAMVDPDNRRAVDWDVRRAMLEEIVAHANGHAMDRQAFAELAENWRDGREKLFLVWRALGLRKNHPALFRDGAYLPLETRGPEADRLCAFARIHDGVASVTVVPRLVGAGIDWGDSEIALPDDRSWRDVLADRAIGRHAAPIAAAEIFQDFPVALWFGSDREG